MSNTPILSINNLSKSYNKQRVLDDINISIPEQSGVIALLGHNGAGKTTLINCILGLCKPEQGKLKLFNTSVGSQICKQRIGAMLQDSDLPNLLTAREQLTLFSSYYPNPLQVSKAIELCDLSSFVDKPYKKLSGGQKRRAQLALALIGQPELIILDEPTSGLDIQARQHLWTTIQTLAEQGKTIILCTHYLEEADALANQIIILKQGKILANASAKKIRQTLSGSLIKCITTLSHEKIKQINNIQRVSTKGRFIELLTNDATKTLSELLVLDPSISELSVNNPTLEEVFSNMQAEEHAEAKT